MKIQNAAYFWLLGSAFLVTSGCAHWKKISPTSLVFRTVEAPYQLQFEPAGKQIFAVLHSGDVVIWASENTQDTKAPLTLSAFADAFAYSYLYPQKRKPVSATWSHNGKYIATASVGGTGKLWEAHTGKLLHSLPGDPQASYSALPSLSRREGIPYAVVFSPHDEWIAIGDDEGHVRFWNTSDQTLAFSLNTEQGPIDQLLWSSEGNFIVTAGTEGNVKMWKMEPGGPRFLATWSVGLAQQVLLSPDGEWVAAVTEQSEVRIWNRTLQKEHTLSFQTSTSSKTLQFSPIHPSHLLLLIHGEEALLWDAQAQKKIRTFPERKPILASFSPEGSYLAFADRAGTLRLRQVSTAQPLGLLGKYEEPPVVWTFHPLGTKMTAAWPNGTIRTWDFLQPTQP